MDLRALCGELTSVGLERLFVVCDADHLARVSKVSALLAERLGLDRRRCELIRIAAPLHDVGKIAVPEAVLSKPGPLSLEERALMERHAEAGYWLLTGKGEPGLELAAEVAWAHHERFDGGGYPRALAGLQIPVEARITAVADVFDALISPRVYRPPLSLDRALEVMRAGRGTHFDPVVLDGFFDLLPAVLGLRPLTTAGSELVAAPAV